MGTGGSGGSGGPFSDDFDGDELDPAWTVLSGSFAVSGGVLVESGGSRFTNTQLLWDGGLTDTPDQYAKLQLVDLGVRSWGFILRFGDSSGHHYEVHLPAGSSEWRWELYDPDFVQQVGSCLGDQPPAPGDWLGVAIEGAGADSKVSVWRWDADPDMGTPDPVANWGPPQCQMQPDPSDDDEVDVDVDDGRGMGVRSFTGNSTASGSIDNWTGGNLVRGECGNGIPESGEACDEGGKTATCDADCTLPMCGDGELNSGAGEDCEVDADCAAGDICLGCTCEASNGRLFSDDFGGSVLDPAWTTLSGSFSVSEGSLVEGGGSRFTNTQLLWGGGLTDTPDQYAKLQLVDLGVRSWGFILRYGDSSDHHYEVHLPAGDSVWRWELYDPDFVGEVGLCLGDQPPAPGDWLGVAIEGAGANTKVSVWRWDADPDAGAPDPAANWGQPDCQVKLDPSVDVDDGRGMGVRSYTGSATSSSSIDNLTGGDLLEPIPEPQDGSITRILSSVGAGTPGSMRDPSGIAVDSADNIYVAACPISPQSEGVFRITPAGVVTQVLDSTGDGLNSANCPVGVAVDSADNVYVATFLSDNVFQISPSGVVTEVLNASGGDGAVLMGPMGVAMDADDTVYVTGHLSDNVFALPAVGGVQVILDAGGGGTGTPLQGPFGVATDATGNVFVAGFDVDTVFKVTPANATSIVLGPAGAGAGLPLAAPHGIAVDAVGDIYVTGNESDNVFRVTPSGVVTVIADVTGDGVGSPMDNPTSIAVDDLGNVYVSAFYSNNAFQIPPGGTPIEIIDATGDGTTPYGRPSDFALAIDSLGFVYVGGIDGDAVFRIDPP